MQNGRYSICDRPAVLRLSGSLSGNGLRSSKLTSCMTSAATSSSGLTQRRINTTNRIKESTISNNSHSFQENNMLPQNRYQKLDKGKGPETGRFKSFGWKRFAVGAGIFIAVVWLFGPRERREQVLGKIKSPCEYRTWTTISAFSFLMAKQKPYSLVYFAGGGSRQYTTSTYFSCL